MQSRKLTTIASSIGLGLALTVGAFSAAKADTVTLRIGSGHPSGPAAYVNQMKYFFQPEVEKRVKARTKHTVKFIEGYAGTVAKVHETLEAVQKGLLDIGGYCVCFEPTKNMGANLTYYVPFTTPDVRVQVKVFRKIINEFPDIYGMLEAKYGQKLMAISGFDNYGIGTKKPWSKASELKGVKIAGAGPNLPWLKYAGAVPVTGTLPSFYNQLQTGVVDGVLIMPGTYYGFKFHEPAPHFKIIDIGAMAQTVLTMNLRKRGKIPKDVLAIIDEVATEYETVATNYSYNKEARGVNSLIRSGATVTYLPKDQQSAWAASLKDWPNERAQEMKKYGHDGPKIMKTYIKYLAEAGHKLPFNYPIKD